MKKNKGFTLAEVLVTLGIIGVVAALTTPALIQNVGDAKIGPRLQKAKATFETAAEMMLNEENANSFLSIGSTGEEIGDRLQNYMKIAKATPLAEEGFGLNNYGIVNQQAGYERYASDDGMFYYIGVGNRINPRASFNNIPNNQLIGIVIVDIDGRQGRSIVAQDLFPFLLYNDGTLRPYGGLNTNRTGNAIPTWQGGNCNDTAVNAPETCTGSIFDNGMKMIYEYVPPRQAAAGGNAAGGNDAGDDGD